MDPIVVLIILIYGIGVSFLEERFGKFEQLEPAEKQFVNALVGFVAPLAASLLTYLGSHGFDYLGSPEELARATLWLLAPVAVWLVTQLAHYVDLWLKRSAPDPQYTTLPVLPK